MKTKHIPASEFISLVQTIRRTNILVLYRMKIPTKATKRVAMRIKSVSLNSKFIIINFLSPWISKIHQICCTNLTTTLATTQTCSQTIRPSLIRNKLSPKTSDSLKKKTSSRIASAKSKRETPSLSQQWKSWKRNWKGTEREGIQKKDFLSNQNTNAISKNAKNPIGPKLHLRTTWKESTEKT